MGTVLVVDDDNDLREVVAEAIAAAGYTVDEAENGQVAVEKMRAETPCIVLLDLMMPVMDGWEVVEIMDADPQLAKVPVCIITAQDRMPPPRNVCLLRKPIRTDDLLEKIAPHCAAKP